MCMCVCVCAHTYFVLINQPPRKFIVPLPQVAQIWPNAAQVGLLGPNRFRPIFSFFNRHRPKVWADLAPTLAEIGRGPSFADFGQHSPPLGGRRVSPQCWADSDQLRARLDGTWGTRPNLGQTQVGGQTRPIASLCRFRPSLPCIWSHSAFGPTSTAFGAIWAELGPMLANIGLHSDHFLGLRSATVLRPR